jgi:hypothetical protein
MAVCRAPLLGIGRGRVRDAPRCTLPFAAWGSFFPPEWAIILSQEPAEEVRGEAAAIRRAQRAIVRAENTAAYANDVLVHLYLIRDRLDSMERETSDLVARFRTDWAASRRCNFP